MGLHFYSRRHFSLTIHVFAFSADGKDSKKIKRFQHLDNSGENELLNKRKDESQGVSAWTS